MYMGVILWTVQKILVCKRVPHVYGGDPTTFLCYTVTLTSVPHVYGGDPMLCIAPLSFGKCSPCIWG